MFIELHNLNGRIDFNVDRIVAMYEKGDGTHLCVTDDERYVVKESIDEIRAILDKAERKISTFENDPIEELLNELPEQETIPLTDKDREDPLPFYVKKFI